MGVKYAELEKLLDTIGKRLDSLEQKEHTHE